jgi:hypothetical protein
MLLWKVGMSVSETGNVFRKWECFQKLGMFSENGNVFRKQKFFFFFWEKMFEFKPFFKSKFSLIFQRVDKLWSKIILNYCL